MHSLGAKNRENQGGKKLNASDAQTARPKIAKSLSHEKNHFPRAENHSWEKEKEKYAKRKKLTLRRTNTFSQYKIKIKGYCVRRFDYFT